MLKAIDATPQLEKGCTDKTLASVNVLPSFGE
jgi:hypothetical protein